jgi:hypothetical protein
MVKRKSRSISSNVSTKQAKGPNVVFANFMSFNEKTNRLWGIITISKRQFAVLSGTLNKPLKFKIIDQPHQDAYGFEHGRPVYYPPQGYSINGYYTKEYKNPDLRVKLAVDKMTQGYARIPDEHYHLVAHLIPIELNKWIFWNAFKG